MNYPAHTRFPFRWRIDPGQLWQREARPTSSMLRDPADLIYAEGGGM
jgi:hypothetical protein